MITDVVFDFFGTLVSYSTKCVAPGETRAYDLLVSRGLRMGYEPFRAALEAAFEDHEREAQRTLREPLLTDILRTFLDRAGLPGAPADLVQEASDAFIQEWNTSTEGLPGLAGFLDGLRGRYRLSVVSNTYCAEVVHENLARLGIRDRFAEVVTSAELGIRKPDPRIFQHALARLGGDPRAAVYVGDSLEPDYRGARGAGWTAYLIDPAGRHPEAAAHRLAHLFDLAGVLGSGSSGG